MRPSVEVCCNSSLTVMCCRDDVSTVRAE